MKKIAVMLLVAALTVSAGDVTAFAGEVNEDIQNIEVIETENDEDIVSYDSEQENYPADWDPEDPQNARAYKQLLGIDDDGTDDGVAVFSMDAGSSRAVSGQKTQWKTASGTTTFIHSDQNADGKTIVPGIDVSYYQGSIDWNKVKASGVKFVILRAGRRAYASGSIAKDSRFEEYYQKATAAGLKVGAYFYSQAISTKEAEEEAAYTLQYIKGKSFDLPIVFDYEYADQSNGRLDNANLSKSQKTACARAYCEKIKSAGYEPMIYANASFLEKDLDTESLKDDYEIWMARYNTYAYDESKDKGSRYGGQINFWQCTSSAKVNGISGNVDFNYWYQDPPADVIYDAASDKWVYAVNGVPDYSYTGFASNHSGRWYVQNGVVDFNYWGIVPDQYGWWRVEAGCINYGFDGVADNEYGWWKFNEGKVDFTFNGVANNEYGWWKFAGGAVDFTYNGIAANEYGWWKFAGGAVDFDFNGVAANEYGWWKFRRGAVDFTYNGIAKNAYGWWKFKGGCVDFSCNGWVEFAGRSYYIKDGCVVR